MARLPPDTSRAVTYVKVEILIDAPEQTVWDAVLDFPSYPKWNSFVRSQAITDASHKPLLAHLRPTEGAHLLMHVRIPPRGLDDDDKGLVSTKEVITFVDETNHRIGWGQVSYPAWLLRAERWQEVTTEEVDGKTLAKYMTIEAFNGPAAWVIRWFMHANLKLAFEAMAEGLKKQAEELARSG